MKFYIIQIIAIIFIVGCNSPHTQIDLSQKDVQSIRIVEHTNARDVKEQSLNDSLTEILISNIVESRKENMVLVFKQRYDIYIILKSGKEKIYQCSGGAIRFDEHSDVYRFNNSFELKNILK